MWPFKKKEPEFRPVVREIIDLLNDDQFDYVNYKNRADYGYFALERRWANYEHIHLTILPGLDVGTHHADVYSSNGEDYAELALTDAERARLVRVGPRFIGGQSDD